MFHEIRSPDQVPCPLQLFLYFHASAPDILVWFRLFWWEERSWGGTGNYVSHSSKQSSLIERETENTELTANRSVRKCPDYFSRIPTTKPLCQRAADDLSLLRNVMTLERQHSKPPLVYHHRQRQELGLRHITMSGNHLLCARTPHPYPTAPVGLESNLATLGCRKTSGNRFRSHSATPGREVT